MTCRELQTFYPSRLVLELSILEVETDISLKRQYSHTELRCMCLQINSVVYDGNMIEPLAVSVMRV